MKKILYIIVITVFSFANIRAQETTDSGYYSGNSIKIRTYTAETAGNYIEDITFYDGLGYPLQMISKGAAVVNTGLSKDIITPVYYDRMWRESRKYLPYVWRHESSLVIDSLALERQAGYYNTAAFGNDEYPYSETEFENSPLSRPTRNFNAGNAFRLATNEKSVSHSYSTNTETDIKKIKYMLSSGDISIVGTYGTKQLHRTESVNEDGHTKVVFTNSAGQTVMERLVNGEYNVDTYYVYDVCNRLVCVISPEGSSQLPSSGVVPSSLLDDYCYLYTYDTKSRLAEKKLPGKEIEYFVYDECDRIAFSQDGNLRANSGNDHPAWIYFDYDKLDRVKHKCIVQLGGNGRDYVQELYNNGENISNDKVHGELYLPFDFVTLKATLQASRYDHYEDFHNPANKPHFATMSLQTFGFGDPEDPEDPEEEELPTPHVGYIPQANVTVPSEYYIDYPYFSNGCISDQYLLTFRDGIRYYWIPEEYMLWMETIAAVFSEAYFISWEPMGIEDEREYFYHKYFLPIDFAPVGNVTEYDDRVTGRLTYEWIGVMDENLSNSYVEYDETMPSGENYVLRTYYYDYKGRLVQTAERNHMGGISRYTTEYDFTGNILKAHESHFRMASDEYPMEKVTEFVYDQRGRVLSETTYLYHYVEEQEAAEDFSLLSFPEEAPEDEATPVNPWGGDYARVLASKATLTYGYDELGKLASKTYGTGVNAVTETYDYNIQGWLTSQSSDLFDMQLRYYDPLERAGVIPSYTGNITEWRWQHKDPTQSSPTQQANSYGFTYDGLSRLTANDHLSATSVSAPGSGWTAVSDGFREYGIDYDLNGNIRALSRSGFHVDTGNPATDILAYTYAGNQLASLGHNNASGSVSASGIKSYDYDANGNMTYDERKGLSFAYNYLNLLSSVSEGELVYSGDIAPMRLMMFGGEEEEEGPGEEDDGGCTGGGEGPGGDPGDPTDDGEDEEPGEEPETPAILPTGMKARYTWLSDGSKLAVVGDDGKGYIYLGSLVYERNGSELKLESTGFGSGRIVASESTDGITYSTNYQITDHLGSVRVVFEDAENVIARNDFYAFGKKHLNSGLEMATGDINRWLFNGKEDQLTGNLGFLDYGARMYDSEIVRWKTMDPLTEKYYSHSPYVFTGNNPIAFIDPDGMDWYYYDDEDGNRQYEYKDYQLSNKEMKALGLTYIGLTGITSDGSQYLSLFGALIDKKDENGRNNLIAEMVEKLDKSIINYEREGYYQQNPPYDFYQPDATTNMALSQQVTASDVFANRHIKKFEYSGGIVTYLLATNISGSFAWGSGESVPISGRTISPGRGVHATVGKGNNDYIVYWTFPSKEIWQARQDQASRLFKNRKW